MAKARHKTATTAALIRTLEDAHRKFERTFQRVIQSLRNDSSPNPRQRPKSGTARTRIAGQTSTGRAAPVQSEIARVLRKRRKGMTMDALRNALPDLDQRSLLNATSAMRRKGLLKFERREKGRGVYSWRMN
jgi:hypothetical protein